MNQDLENYYKLTLSHDLILFMMHLQFDGLNNEQKARRTNMILEAWEQRVNSKLETLEKENIENIAEITQQDLDVLQIIKDIHSHEPTAIRKEFKREIRHTVFKSFDKQEI